MLDRLNPAPIFRGHWKSLSSENAHGQTIPDWPTRIAILGLPALVVGLSWWKSWQLGSPAALLTGITLLFSGSLALFAQVSTLRLKLTDSYEDDDRGVQVDRDSLDEGTAHLLAAAVLCAVEVGLLVGAITTTPAEDSSVVVTGWIVPTILGLLTYIGLLFLMLIPRLYNSYVTVNAVRSELNGFSVDRSRRRIRH